MPDWDATQYLRFVPKSGHDPAVIWLPELRPCLRGRWSTWGAAPGNSTQVLAEQWPAAALTGLDSSSEMIEAARRTAPAVRWLVGDITSWTADAVGLYDIVFSNAALQWVPDHTRLLPAALGPGRPGRRPGRAGPEQHQCPRSCHRPEPGGFVRLERPFSRPRECANGTCMMPVSITTS